MTQVLVIDYLRCLPKSNIKLSFSINNYGEQLNNHTSFFIPFNEYAYVLSQKFLSILNIPLYIYIYIIIYLKLITNSKNT